MKLYKVLNKDLTPIYYGDSPYIIGEKNICPDFDTGNKECAPGYYAVGIEGIPYAWINNGKRVVVEVEVGGRSREFDQYKRRFEEQTVLRVLDNSEVMALAKAEESRLGYKLSEVIFPTDPHKIDVPFSDKHIELAKQWAEVVSEANASVKDSVWDSVRASVDYSVYYSVRDSVRDSVWDSVRNSVGYSVYHSVDYSVYAYISSLFPNIEQWQGFDHEPGENPFQPAIDLWNDGYGVSVVKGVVRIHKLCNSGEAVWKT